MRLIGSILFALLFSTLTTGDAYDCAGGCGVFSVGTSSLLPGGKGGAAPLQVQHGV